MKLLRDKHLPRFCFSLFAVTMRAVRLIGHVRYINILFTAPFNDMRTLKFKAQPTNAFFATVNQMLAGSSQLSTAAERAVIKLLSTVQTTIRVRQ